MEYQATPSTIAAVVGQAQAGDTVVMGAGTYTTMPWKAGIHYKAHDAADGRALKGTTGHKGNGFTVKVTAPFNVNVDDVTVEGVYHDTSGLAQINAGVITGDRVRLLNMCSYARRTDGGRQIGYTIGTGTKAAAGFVYENSRHSGTGQVGSNYDHAFYFKNAISPRITHSIVHDGGEYPLHLYPNCDSLVVEYSIVYWGQRCITISGENVKANTSVGFPTGAGDPTYYTSDNNVFRYSILGGNSEGSTIEAWAPSGSGGVKNNVVQECLLWTAGRGGVANTTPPAGVSYAGVQVKDPLFTNPAGGDYSRPGAWDGYGPKWVFTDVKPPPPPSPTPDLQAVKDGLDQTVMALNARLATLDLVRLDLQVTMTDLTDLRNSVQQLRASLN
jgi:hypothetical protein